MSPTLAVGDSVADDAAWRPVYDRLALLRAGYGCTGRRVSRGPAETNGLFITHAFPSAGQAAGFARVARLKEGMQAAGVTSAPRTGIFEVA